MTTEKDGNYIIPGTSPKVKDYIEKGRIILAQRDGEMIQKAMTMGQGVDQGVELVVKMLVTQLEGKLGPLEPQELQQLVAHLVGTIAYMGKAMGEPTLSGPDAGNTIQGIIKNVMNDLLQSGQAAPPPPGLLGGGEGVQP